jgi:hypothetical protein
MKSDLQKNKSKQREEKEKKKRRRREISPYKQKGFKAK